MNEIGLRTLKTELNRAKHYLDVADDDLAKAEAEVTRQRAYRDELMARVEALGEALWDAQQVSA